MAFGQKRKLVDQNDAEEVDTVDVDLSYACDEHGSNAYGPNKEDESAFEHGTNNYAKSLIDETIILDAPKGKNSGGTKASRCKHCQKNSKVATQEFFSTSFVLVLVRRHKSKASSIRNHMTRYMHMFL